jgi:cytoskeleton protein RodZ
MDREIKLGSCSGWPELASIRRSRKISLRRIAAITKIRLHYLKAIEAGHFDELPGGVYATSYIRQYARIVDFDEDDLLARFRPTTSEESAPSESETDQHDVARLWNWLLHRSTPGAGAG